MSLDQFLRNLFLLFIQLLFFLSLIAALEFTSGSITIFLIDQFQNYTTIVVTEHAMNITHTIVIGATLYLGIWLYIVLKDARQKICAYFEQSTFE